MYQHVLGKSGGGWSLSCEFSHTKSVAILTNYLSYNEHKNLSIITVGRQEITESRQDHLLKPQELLFLQEPHFIIKIRFTRD